MRPIPVDIIPAHVYLSQRDQVTLFGDGYAMTVEGALSQAGQFVCTESVEVFGKLKRSLHLRVLGPYWQDSHVEVTSTLAAYLGYDLSEVRTGDTSKAKPCRLLGPQGEVELQAGLIAVGAHLCCSPQDATTLGVVNGEKISMELLTQSTQEIHDVIVRVHPTFDLRLELTQDHARTYWITRSIHARLCQ